VARALTLGSVAVPAAAFLLATPHFGGYDGYFVFLWRAEKAMAVNSSMAVSKGPDARIDHYIDVDGLTIDVSNFVWVGGRAALARGECR